MEEENININVDLLDALRFAQSDIFDALLANNTTISNYLFIKNLVIKTIQNMINTQEDDNGS